MVAELEGEVRRLGTAAENGVYLDNMRQELARNQEDVDAARRLKRHVE
jgi:hypothetical protein